MFEKGASRSAFGIECEPPAPEDQREERDVLCEDEFHLGEGSKPEGGEEAGKVRVPGRKAAVNREGPFTPEPSAKSPEL